MAIALAAACVVVPASASSLFRPDLAASQAGPAATSAQAQAIVTAAKKWLTTPVTPYCWGGGDDSGPTHGFGEDAAHYAGPKGKSGCYAASAEGFDCSGLVKYAIYQALGISLDHSAQDQSEGLTDTGPNAHPKIIKVADLEPGDIVVFGSSASNIAHDGIYAGNGELINAYDYKNDGDNGTNNEYWGVDELPLSWAKGAFTFYEGIRYWKTTSNPAPSPSPTTPAASPTASPAPTGSDNWAQPGHDAAQNYDNPAETRIGTGDVSRLARAWSVPLTTRVQQPIVYQGQVYRLTATMTGPNRAANVLSASQLSTGKLLWSRSLGGSGLDTLYAAGDDKILYGSAGPGDTLVAVSASTGGQLWSTSDAGFADGGGEVLMDGTTVIDGVVDVQVLSAVTGKQLWRATDGAGSGGPDAFAVSQKRVIRLARISGRNYLESRDEATGAVQWKRAAPCSATAANASLAIGTALIFLNDSCSATLRAYHLSTGAQAWKVADGGIRPDLGLATSGTTVFAMAQISDQAAVVAYSGGKSSWQALLGAGTYPGSTPSLAGGVLYATVDTSGSSADGTERTTALSTAAGAKLWTSPVQRETLDTPFVAEGKLLVGSVVYGPA